MRAARRSLFARFASRASHVLPASEVTQASDASRSPRTTRSARTSLAPIATLAALGALATMAAVAACTTDYQKGVDDPNYGGPNALAGQRAPGPTADNTTPTGDGGAANATAPLCVRSGGTVVDGGACAVSFAKDVLAALGNSTPPCAQANCHGGTSPPNLPRVEPSEPAAMWTEFTTFQLGQLPYVNPCSTDVAQSGLACNLYSSGQQGACGVHMPQGGQLVADDITKIETWLKCGAPNN